MIYKPRLPSINNNISHDKPGKEFLLLFSGILFFLLVAYWALGLFVDLAVKTISPKMEATLFSSFSLPYPHISNNKKQQLELQRIVDALQQCAQLKYPLTVHLVKSEEANAIALPGGRIIVLSALLDKVESENGLSFILAHELAHYQNRDHLHGLGKGIVLTALLAFLTGTDSGLTQMVSSTLNLSQAQYSQKREAQADKMALEITNCFYGHVGGATEFFEAMKEDQNRTKFMSHYFASHPEAVKRIENLNKLANRLNFQEGKVQQLSSRLKDPKKDEPASKKAP